MISVEKTAAVHAPLYERLEHVEWLADELAKDVQRKQELLREVIANADESAEEPYLVSDDLIDRIRKELSESDSIKHKGDDE